MADGDQAVTGVDGLVDSALLVTNRDDTIARVDGLWFCDGAGFGSGDSGGEGGCESDDDLSRMHFGVRIG